MPRTAPRRRPALLAGAAIALSLSALLCSCRPVAVTTVADTAAPSGATSVSSSPTTGGTGTGAATGSSSPAASQTGTFGSVTLSITSPVQLSGTASTSVSCSTGVSYRATVARAVVNGDTVSFNVAIARYRGPGSYAAVVGVTLYQGSGAVTTLAGVSRIPAVITSGGGSFSVSATSAEGRTFSGSLSWVCG